MAAGFARGLDDALAPEGPGTLQSLFAARARGLFHELAAEALPGYLSGLLIGAEVAATPALLGIGPGASLAVIGDPALCARYARAMAFHGYQVRNFDGEQAVLAGLAAFYRGVAASC
jgi:2-dehydro-3-deoxygalactonokinase